MKKFFSKFILKKNSSSFKVDVTDNCITFNTIDIDNFKFNNINIKEYIENLNNKINSLESKINNLEDKINNIEPFDIENYLNENNLSISKGTILVK